jgi:hypothetical protein
VGTRRKASKKAGRVFVTEATLRRDGAPLRRDEARREKPPLRREEARHVGPLRRKHQVHSETCMRKRCKKYKMKLLH